MSVNIYDNGDLIIVSAVFTDSVGAAIDPSTVTFKFKDPAGTTTTYLYGTDAELVRDSVGNYHVDLSPTVRGDYLYRYESTGTGQAAEEHSFSVRRGNF